LIQLWRAAEITSHRFWRCGARTTPSCPAGAEAFKRDIPGAEVRFFDTGHFALETHCAEIAAVIRDFLDRMLRLSSGGVNT
jgi:pimeloyl-ACP methyl ester carboxylesterase